MQQTTLQNRRAVSLPSRIRALHLYVIGKTQTGKSNLLITIALQDMLRGDGIGFIDPHGDTAEKLLGIVPKHRLKDVIYFNPTKPYCPSLNILRLPYPPDKLTADIVSMFKLFFGSSWGNKMAHFLRWTLTTLITDTEPHTLLDLYTILTDATYRSDIVRRVEHPRLKSFWKIDYDNDKQSVGAILNKLSEFLLPYSPLERILSHAENDLNFSDIINNKKILIANLAKGTLGDDPSYLLGGMLATGLQQAALARTTIPEHKRNPFYLTVDEFQNYAVESFGSILSETAKYKLHLNLAHQLLKQGKVTQELQKAIFGNISTLVAFRVSAEDAATVAREMQRTTTTARLHAHAESMSYSRLLAAVRAILLEKYLYYKGEEEAAEERNREVGGSGGYYIQAGCLKRDIKRALDAVNSPDVTPELLHEITRKKYGVVLFGKEFLDNLENNGNGVRFFGDWHFTTTTHPSPSDLINLKAYRCYIRVERAANTYLIKTVPAPRPKKEKRDAIIALTKKHYNERHPQRQEARHEPPREDAPPSTPQETQENHEQPTQRHTTPRAERTSETTNKKPPPTDPKKDDDFTF